MPIQVRAYSPGPPGSDIDRIHSIRFPFRSRLNFLRLLLPPATPHSNGSDTNNTDIRPYAQRHFLLRNMERLTDLEDSEDDSSDDDSEIENHFLPQRFRRSRQGSSTDVQERHSEDSSRAVLTDVQESDNSEDSNDTIENFEASFFNGIYLNQRSSLEEEKSSQEVVDDQVVQDIMKKRAMHDKECTIYLTADGNYDPMVSFIARVLDVTFRGAPRRGIVCCKDVLPIGERESHLDPRGLDAIMDKLSRIIEDIPSSSTQGNHVYDYIQAIETDKYMIDR